MSQISLEGIYVAYFGRAADPAGLSYWLGQESAGSSDSTIALQFVPQTETLALYPALNTPATLESSPSSQASFITSVYQNLFGHAPDPAGLSYWQAQLTAGANPGFMVYQIIIGATGTDATTVANRETVSSNYTNAITAHTNPPLSWNGNTDPAQSRAIITTINSTAATVTTAATYIAQDIGNDVTGTNSPLLIFNGAIAASTVTATASTGLATVQTGSVTGLNFISSADTTGNTALTADVDILNGYVGGATQIDLAGLTTQGWHYDFALTQQQLAVTTAAGSLLTAVNEVAAMIHATGVITQVIAFAFGGNEYIYQDKAGAATISAGDGLLQVTGAALTYRPSDLALT